jgi:hypothetical protein
MAQETISFDIEGEGWNSFHSWHPDMMVGINNNLYTFKNGSLWKHNNHSEYNNFYDVNYDSTIKFVFNDNALDNKVFKTLVLDSNDTWAADLETDLTNGVVDHDYYVKKEGSYYGYIRRDENVIENEHLSVQGVGTIVAWDGGSNLMTFAFNINSSISNGDKVYRTSGGTLELIGNVVSHTKKTITLNGAAVTPVANADNIVFVKDSTAESNGIRGSKMIVELSNSSTSSVDLFSVDTEIYKSNQ